LGDGQKTPQPQVKNVYDSPQAPPANDEERRKALERLDGLLLPQVAPDPGYARQALSKRQKKARAKAKAARKARKAAR